MNLLVELISAAFFRADRAGEKGRSPGALVDAPITEVILFYFLI